MMANVLPRGNEITFKLKRASLAWEYEDGYQWCAFSIYQHDGVPFKWRVNCCDDGLFTIEHSTHELITGISYSQMNMFKTLADAKVFCEEHEAISAKGKWKKECEIKSQLHLAILRPHSIVVNGVRMFPPLRKESVKGFTITPKEDEIRLDVDAVLRTAAVAIRIKTDGKDGWATVARDVDRLASLDSIPYKLDTQ